MVQLYKGKLEEWSDEEGFGIVKSVHNRRDVFIHISSLEEGVNPIIGDMIEYNIIRNKDGQDEAINARILPRIESKEPKEKSSTLLYLSIFLIIIISIPAVGYYMEFYKSDIFREYFPAIADELTPPPKVEKSISKSVEKSVTPKVVIKEEPIIFACNGKTTCDEMLSCGQAIFYISNCPNTEKLDADNDGIPCEKQLCGNVDIDENAIEVSAPSVKDMYTPSNDLKCDGRIYCSQMTSCEEATYFLRNCPNTKMDGDADGVPCESQWCGH